MADVDRLVDLLDVLLTNPQVGDSLKYDGTKWVNGISGGTLSGRTEIILNPTTEQVHAGSFHHMNWIHSAGDEILDFTFPDTPHFPPGLYVVSATVYAASIQAVGTRANLGLGAIGVPSVFAETSIPLDLDIPAENPAGTATVSFFAPDGNYLQASIHHAIPDAGDGSGVLFNLGATVTQILLT